MNLFVNWFVWLCWSVIILILLKIGIWSSYENKSCTIVSGNFYKAIKRAVLPSFGLWNFRLLIWNYIFAFVICFYNFYLLSIIQFDPLQIAIKFLQKKRTFLHSDSQIYFVRFSKLNVYSIVKTQWGPNIATAWYPYEPKSAPPVAPYWYLLKNFELIHAFRAVSKERNPYFQKDKDSSLTYFNLLVSNLVKFFWTKSSIEPKVPKRRMKR